MTLKRFSILAILVAGTAIPAAALVVSFGPHALSAGDWIDRTYGKVAGLLELPLAEAGWTQQKAPLPVEKDVARHENEHALPADQPWEDPDWNEKVAAKLLEKLIEMPDVPPGTGTLQEQPAASTDRIAALPQEQAWANPPPKPSATSVPEAPTPTERANAATPEPVQNRAEPAETVVATLPPAEPEDPATELLTLAPPPPVPSPETALLPDAVNEGTSGDEAGDPPGAASLSPAGDYRADTEVLRENESEDAAVPIPPPRPLAARSAPDDDKRTSGRARARQEENARRIAARYLQSWSTENPQAMAAMQQLSGQRIEYFGHPISKRAWIQKKESFAANWPVRLYRHRPGTMSVRCGDDIDRCVVKSTVDWETISPSRGDFAAGVSQLELGIDLSGPQPKIFRESNLRVRARRNLPRPVERPEEPQILQHELPPQAFVE